MHQHEDKKKFERLEGILTDILIKTDQKQRHPPSSRDATHSAMKSDFQEQLMEAVKETSNKLNELVAYTKSISTNTGTVEPSLSSLSTINNTESTNKKDDLLMDLVKDISGILKVMRQNQSPSEDDIQNLEVKHNKNGKIPIKKKVIFVSLTNRIPSSQNLLSQVKSRNPTITRGIIQ
jgi:hypothetical protein